jgi:hypothetical protein
VAQVLSVESLVDIVFLRGMTMQNAVERDDSGMMRLFDSIPYLFPIMFSNGFLSYRCVRLLISRPIELRHGGRES